VTGPLAQRAFPPEHAAVRAAREFVRHQLAEVEADVRDTAVLMVSELASNSVSHASTSFRVSVGVAGSVVRVEVADLDPTIPKPQDVTLRDLSGRGLAIVARLAADWAIEPAAGGKVVWFTLSTQAR